MPTTRRGPITDAEKRKIRALHKKGLGRNAIAKQVGVSLATVTKVCAAAGLSFDRAATAQAVAARSIDLKAIKLELIELDYLRARTIHHRLRETTYTYSVVVAGRGVESVTEAFPPAQDERALAGAIETYKRAAERAESTLPDEGLVESKTMIQALAEQIGLLDD